MNVQSSCHITFYFFLTGEELARYPHCKICYTFEVPMQLTSFSTIKTFPIYCEENRKPAFILIEVLYFDGDNLSRFADVENIFIGCTYRQTQTA